VISSVDPDPVRKCRTPALMTRDLCVPLNGTRTPLSEVRTIQDKISGRRIPWPKSRTYRGPAQTLVRVLSGAPPLPALAGPGAAARPTARDVSRRADSDVRPLGHAISAFIAEIVRRMSALQTGDVPTRYLMCPVQSDGRRRPDHLTGGVPVQSDSGQYAHTAARAQQPS
jgi:hypothetical protein